jgi:periplasmic divalent cation tolerance protein
MTDKIVILSTCESEEEASLIARHLVEQRVAACVNILAGAKSVYRWKDKVEQAPEFLLIIKSRRDLFAAVREHLVKFHSYEVPEVLALAVLDGSDSYLGWLDRELSPAADD